MTRATKRAELNEAFIEALQNDFDIHGPDVIEKLRATDTRAYAQLVAALVPKRLEVDSAHDPFSGLTEAELERWLVHDCAANMERNERVIIKARALLASGKPINTDLPDETPEPVLTRRRGGLVGIPRQR